MINYDHLFLISYLIPFFIVILFIFFSFDEKKVKYITNFSNVLPFISNLYFSIKLLINHFESFDIPINEILLGEHHFQITFYVDILTIAFLILTNYLSILVGHFSHSYLHREKNYQGFFKIIQLFLFGLYLLSLAGNLNIFFMGWEIVGFSSFLLIAFYNERTRPIKNAFRIFSIYRICDVGLLMGGLLSFIYWEHAGDFKILFDVDLDHFKDYSMRSTNILGALIILAAIGKSAQWPFINWPARAMEGPTPSSAIFYGGLSLHCGVVLILRTYPIWQHSLWIKLAIISIGFLSYFYSRQITVVQPTIKGQLAYLSTAQIGLMFIEVAFGWINFAIFHLFSHCILRTYQLLTSPSTIVEHVKNLTSDIECNIKIKNNGMMKRLQITKVIFMLQEALVSPTERGLLPYPFIKMKIFLRNWGQSKFKVVLSLLFLHFIGFLLFNFWGISQFDSFIMLLDIYLSVYCLVSTRSPMRVWGIFLFTQVLFVLNLILNHASNYTLILYAISAIPCWIFGFFALNNLNQIDLTKFNGLNSIYPHKTKLFFIAFIGFTGLPFTTIFFAEDLLFHDLLHANAFVIAASFFSLTFNGLIVARILVKTFWGFPTRFEY